MPYKKVRNRRAALSDNGFEVEWAESPRSELVIRYTENDHVIEYREDDVTPGSCAVYIDRLTGWQPPFADEALSGHRKAVIAERIASAMGFLGEDCEVFYPPGWALKAWDRSDET